MKGINKGTSAAETDMSLVTLPYQNLKACHKLQLEGTIGKWLEAHRVAEPHINTISVMTVLASMSVSQYKIFLVQGANTAMKMNSAIVEDSATGQKKFKARQWEALI